MLFTITADKDRAVKEVIESIKEEGWEPYHRDTEIAETVHTMRNSKEAFRLIVQRWRKLQGELFDPEPYCYHAILLGRTNRGRRHPKRWYPGITNEGKRRTILRNC